MIIIIICAIINIWAGTTILNMSMEGPAGTFMSIVGFIFVALGVLSFWPLIERIKNAHSRNIIQSNQQAAHDKYIRGLNILKGYYDLGINNISEIKNPEERRNVQNIYNYCESYSNQRKKIRHINDYYDEGSTDYNEIQKSNENINIAATVAAGVALGTVLSSAVSKAVRSSYDKTLEYMRKNINRKF